MMMVIINVYVKCHTIVKMQLFLYKKKKKSNFGIFQSEKVIAVKNMSLRVYGNFLMRLLYGAQTILYAYSTNASNPSKSFQNTHALHPFFELEQLFYIMYVHADALLRVHHHTLFKLYNSSYGFLIGAQYIFIRVK